MSPRDAPATATAEADRPWRVADRAAHCGPSAIADALAMAARSRAIGLAAGSPATEALVDDELQDVVAGAMRRAPQALQYTDPVGLPDLRAWIADDETRRTGRTWRPEQVIVTHGSQQGLDLVCRALLDPGDTVVVDRPAYSGALQILGMHGARIVPAPLTEEPGLDELARVLERLAPVRMLYVVPSFANPSGATLTGEQRARLAALADRHGCVVVEDDPYHELHFGAPPPSSTLTGLCRRAVRLGSFSKTFFPGARTGYLLAPEPLRPVLTRLKEATDLGNSALLQTVLHTALTTDGLPARRYERLRGVYRRRRDTFTAALRAHCEGLLTFTEPEGGFFVWATLADGTDATRLLDRALAHQVAFVPGAAFHTGGDGAPTLRLSYSAAPHDLLEEGCARLARAIGETRVPRPAEAEWEPAAALTGPPEVRR
ncbi:PLP-dependent aminotransferase family protein [Streptomyces sp. NPDC094032]|uniref:aminotransferase-like domain-containing protein n=1 Tax=Streptomyces sp. NPDC094032 TaxID=3155308 RepID=UPI00332A5F9D